MSQRVSILTLIVLAGVVAGLWSVASTVADMRDGDRTVTVRVQQPYIVGEQPAYTLPPVSIETMRHEFGLDQPLKGDLKP